MLCSRLVELLQKLIQRSMLAFLEGLVAALANTQTAEDASVPNLGIKLITGLAWQWAPCILGDWHVAVFLETGEVHFVQGRSDGLYLGRYKQRLFLGHGLDGASGAFGSWNEILQRGVGVAIFGGRG